MTQNVNIAVKTESGQVKKISHGVIFQPETQFKGGSVKWFDDSNINRTLGSKRSHLHEMGGSRLIHK